MAWTWSHRIEGPLFFGGRLLDNLLASLWHLKCGLLSYNHLHASRLVQIVRWWSSVCLRSSTKSTSTFFKARLLFIVARSDISFLILNFLTEARRIRAKGHRRVVLDSQRGQQRIVDRLGLLSNHVSNRICLVIVLHALQTWILLRLLDDLVVGAIPLGLRYEHRAAPLDFFFMDPTLVLIGILAWSRCFSDIEFRLSFLLTIEWFLVSNSSSHDLLCQVLPIVVLSRARGDDFLSTELILRFDSSIFSAFRACKSITARWEAHIGSCLAHRRIIHHLASFECRGACHIVMTRSQFFSHLLVSCLLCEAFDSGAEELEAMRLGLRAEVAYLGVKVLARTRCHIFVVTLEDVLDALLLVGR